MPNLADRIAIVTGAGTGIGRETAVALADAGAAVMLAGRRLDRVQAVADDIAQRGGRARAASCDVSDRGQMQALVEATGRDLGPVDIFVANAGIMPLSPLARTRIDEWADTVDINLKGVLYGLGYVLPVMLERGTGHVVAISSTAGRKVFPGATVYCATKHAIHALCEGLRAELAERAASDGNTIRVSIIAPGVVDTELLESIRDEKARAAADEYWASIPNALQGGDVAAAVMHALLAPPHVNVNEILVRPVRQLR